MKHYCYQLLLEKYGRNEIFSRMLQYHTGWRHNKYRSVSYTFGSDVIEKFLADNNLQLIVRAHQVIHYSH